MFKKVCILIRKILVIASKKGSEDPFSKDLSSYRFGQDQVGLFSLNLLRFGSRTSMFARFRYSASLCPETVNQLV